MWLGTFTHTCTAPQGMVVRTCCLQGRQPLPWSRSPVSFEQISQTSFFSWQLLTVIWHIYSIQCCFKGVLGMDLPSSGDVAVTMGQVPCECWDGAIHLPSSGEVLLGLGKVPCESVEDHTKHWGSYPWGVCHGPRPLKSESGRMEQWNVVSSYVWISELLSKPLFH